jgi:hypothetical protein
LVVRKGEQMAFLSKKARNYELEMLASRRRRRHEKVLSNRDMADEEGGCFLIYINSTRDFTWVSARAVKTQAGRPLA